MGKIDLRKKKLRKHFLKIRHGLDREHRERKSRQILDNLTKWGLYAKSITIHCFLTIEKNAEVQTGPILDRMAGDGKRVAVPRTAAGSKKLEHVIYQGPESLKISAMGIPEPFGGETVSADELDMVLVPMISADLKKNRLGYGLGYYDRFLAGTEALKVGLLFEECISVETLPVHGHDVKLDYLITEDGIR